MTIKVAFPCIIAQFYIHNVIRFISHVVLKIKQNIHIFCLLNFNNYLFNIIVIIIIPIRSVKKHVFHKIQFFYFKQATKSISHTSDTAS